MKTFVNINDSRWNKVRQFPFAGEGVSIAQAIDGVAGFALGGKYKNSEISITLTNDGQMQALNRDYRGLDAPTNVLSFESGDAELPGDIFISYDAVHRESAEQGISFGSHLAHLVVHGVLHLQGFDHIKRLDAWRMERREKKILKEIAGGVKKKKSPLAARCALLAALGVIASLGFAPLNFWWATIIGIGGAYRLIGKWPRIWLFAFCFGAFYAMASFWWVVNSIFVVPDLAAQFAVWTAPAIAGIGVVGAMVFSIPFFFARRGPVAFAAAWTAVLWLREWLLTGFPWNPVVNIALPWPALANSMALWGALGLTFVIVGFIASIARNGKKKELIIFSILLLIGVGYGYYNINKSELQASGQIIRIVQPASTAAQKATHSRADAIRNANENISKLRELAAAPGNYDLIIFPETAYPYLLPQNLEKMDLSFGAPFVIGANTWNAGKYYNSMIFAAADGKITSIYSKSHLVPFGEYRPLGDLIPTPGQLTRGGGPEIINNFIPAICYEIVFTDSLMPADNRQLPTAIINITNDTWFGKTPGTYQHLDMARRYAIESGLPVIRANYSGVSAFIGADGRVLKSLPVGVAGVLDGTVGGTHDTPYRDVGRDLMMAIILLLAAIGLAWPVSLKGRGGRRPGWFTEFN
ncbi:MAG: apolipoprotein N-acyltransferase [Rickettsiales bacterium]|jgi:apolipoprotein N-acyltransferase|nr:apolipoprotein N-acyltransferase [Rickettsiales bacterium]